jgi:hypothetical protein
MKDLIPALRLFNIQCTHRRSSQLCKQCIKINKKGQARGQRISHHIQQSLKV